MFGKPAAGESSPQASFLISVRTRALPRRTRARGAETRAQRGGVGVWFFLNTNDQLPILAVDFFFFLGQY